MRTITTTFSLSYFVSARIFPSVYESVVPRSQRRKFKKVIIVTHSLCSITETCSKHYELLFANLPADFGAFSSEKKRTLGELMQKR